MMKVIGACEKQYQNLKTEKGFKRGWGKTFSSIVYVSEGILNDSVWDDIPYVYNDPNVIDVLLKNIAFINLKKVAGVSKSKSKRAISKLIKIIKKYSLNK